MLKAVNNLEALVNVQQYRLELRLLSTVQLVNKLRERRDELKNIAALHSTFPPRDTDDWQARELLAELGSRQLSFDDQGTVSS